VDPKDGTMDKEEGVATCVAGRSSVEAVVRNCSQSSKPKAVMRKGQRRQRRAEKTRLAEETGDEGAGTQKSEHVAPRE
jgi:hypothetical protein